MSGAPETPRETARDSLAWLLDDLHDAREAESYVVRRGVRADMMFPAQLRTLRALEAYVDALDGLAWPIPRQIRMDLRLHLRLCALHAGWPDARD